MIKLVALAFDLPGNYFNRCTEAQSNGMRISHYSQQQDDSKEHSGSYRFASFNIS